VAEAVAEEAWVQAVAVSAQEEEEEEEEEEAAAWGLAAAAEVWGWSCLEEVVAEVAVNRIRRRRQIRARLLRKALRTTPIFGYLISCFP
jgi:hypothetical protein